MSCGEVRCPKTTITSPLLPGHVTSIWSAREFAEDVVLTPEQIEKSFALTDLFGKKGWNVAKSEFSGLGESPLCSRCCAPCSRRIT